jgi:hypothetical protein
MVAVGSGSGIQKIAYSINGNEWFPSTISVLSNGATNIAYGNGMWIAAGSGGNTIAYSTNGITWKGSATNGGLSFVGDIAYGKNSSDNDVWVACGNNGVTIKMATSTDGGNTWVQCATNGGLTNSSNTVAYGKDNLGAGLWIVGGHSSAAGPRIVRSTTGGNSWAACATNGGIIGTVQGVAYGQDGANNGLWIAVGVKSGSGNTIAYSSDGNTWYPVVDASLGGFTESANGVAYGKDDLGVGLWVAVGSSANRIATSRNGTTWIGRSVAGLTNVGYSVAYGQDALGNWLWIAGGNGGNTIATSTNGTTWTGVTSNGGLSSQASNIAIKN